MSNFSLSDISFTTSKLWTPERRSLFWLDNVETSTVTLGTGISQWNDKSGNNNHVSQSTASAQPSISPNEINGKSAVRFTKATNQFLSSLTSIANNYKVIAVLKPANLTASQGSLVKNGGIVSGNAGTGVGWGNGTFETAGAANLVGLKEIITWHTTPISLVSGYQIFTMQLLSNNLFSGSINNSTLTDLTNNNVPQPAANFLGIAGYGSRCIDAWIAELIILPATGEELKAQGYLAAKYNLTASLNAGHPFKSRSPLV